MAHPERSRKSKKLARTSASSRPTRTSEQRGVPRANETTTRQAAERKSPRQQRAVRARQAQLKRLLKWGGALAAVVVAGVLLWGLLASRSGAPGTTAAIPDVYNLAGQPALDFTLQDVTNKPVALHAYLGKRVVVNFWYATCPGCQQEMPDFERYYQQAQDQDIVILGVNVLDDARTASQFMQQLGITYPVVLDSQQQVFLRLYHLTSTPSSIFIDAQGIIRGSVAGAITLGQLQAYVSALH